MARRKESKLEKLRLEEKELDNQLREAGLFEDGMDFEMKKMMLATLEESRKSAQQEESQRQQWKEQEDQLIKETLNRSFRSNSEERHQGELGSSEEHENDEDSRDSDIVALPLEDVANTNCLSDSGSVTPDLDPLRSGSPEQVVPSTSPPFTCSLNSSLPGAAVARTSKGDTRESQVQPHSSEEDLFCDSQSSNNSKTSNLSPKRSIQLRDGVKTCEVQEREVRDTIAATSQTIVDVEEHDSSGISSSIKKNGGFSPNKHQIIEPRRPLRRSSSVEVVPSPNARSEGGKNQTQQLTQSLFSRRLGEGFEDEDGVQLLSPVICQRKTLESLNVSINKSEKMKSLQDAKVSNSFEVEAEQQTLEATVDDDDDDEDFILPTPSASQSSVTRFESLELHSSVPGNSVPIASQNIFQESGRFHKEALARDDSVVLHRISQRPSCSTTNDSSNLYEEEKMKLTYSNLELSDSEENLSFNFKNDRKRNVNVFFPEETPSMPLKRRRLDKTEDPSKAYFRSSNESPQNCASRILDMIDDMMKRIGEHQVKTLLYKIKWSAPLLVDKRLKDSIERSKVQSRKNVTELDADCKNLHPQRITRNTPKLAESLEMESHASEDSLSDVCLNNGGWIDVKEKRRGKKRSLHFGLGRKQTKVPAFLEETEGVLSSHQDEKNVVYESDDTDDFEIFPSNSLTRKKSLFGQTEAESTSTSLKDKNMECSEVSSSKMCDTGVEKSGGAASERVNIQVDSQMFEEEGLTDLNKRDLPNEKRQKVESSELLEEITENKLCATTENRSRKRRLRKTFMLSSEDSDEQQKSLDDVEPSTSTAQDLGISRPSDLTSVQPDNEQLLHNNMNRINNSGAIDTEHSLKPSAKRDNLGRNINVSSFVSSSGKEEDHDSKVGPSNSADICIVEDSINLPGPSGIISTRFINKESRRGKSNRDQIRPGPLRLKKNLSRNKGANIALENPSAAENEAEQITSSVGIAGQALSEKGQASNVDKKEGSDEDLVPCPLCQNLFPVQQIEIHASDCLIDSPQTQQPTEVARKGKRKRIQKKQANPDVEIEQVSEGIRTSSITATAEARTPVGHERCTFCKKFFKEGDDFLIHVKSCKSMEAIHHNIVSPTTPRTPGRSERTRGSTHTPNRGMGGSTPIVRTNSLFDHLEDA